MKTNFKTKIEAIRYILMTYWDPIGVKDVPQAADEYDSYLPVVLQMLENDVAAEEIASHLDDLTQTDIGLQAQGKQSQIAAEQLIALKARAWVFK